MPHKFITWSWEEAFDKFGFDDGDGPVMTDVVVAVLQDAGYRVTAETWGSHNVVIFSIKDANGAEQIPSDINLGYDEPRDYLPEAVIALLDTDSRTGDDPKGGAL
jgi:hypothetical protein